MKHNPAVWHSVTTPSGDMRLFVARPEKAKAPAVIVLQEAFGVNAHIRDVTTRIAALGYVAAAPELYHRTAPPGFEVDYNNIEKARPHMDALTTVYLEEDIHATCSWLQADIQTDANAVAAVGYCLGGKAAFLANGILRLKAAVSYYGTGIPSILQAYAGAQHGPLLMFWGGQDANSDPAKRAAIADTLRNHKKTFTQVEFSAAGHGFFCEERKSYNPQAALESWALMAMFLKNRLQDAA